MNCKLFKKCGSCHYLDREYISQLEIKKEYCSSLIEKNHLSLKIETIIGAKDPYFYRNKIIIGFTKDGKPGFYEENSHEVIPYQGCLLDDETGDAIILYIAELIKKYRIMIFNADRKTGWLRHLLIRCGKSSNQYMVTIVAASLIFPGSKGFVQELTTKFPCIKTIVLNENKRITSIVLGEKYKTIYGKGYIEDNLCGLKFHISPQSFYQINHDQCEELYRKALSMLSLSKEDIVLDTYCGIGTIGMIASINCKQVVGIELNRQAVNDAINNAKRNHIENIQFICGDSTKCMQELAKQKIQVDALIMDPPREGSTKIFIESLNRLNVKKVVYISCEPATQIRDLTVFKQYGYDMSDMVVVDMFPHTRSCESIVMLTKHTRIENQNNGGLKMNGYQKEDQRGIKRDFKRRKK